MAEEDQVPKEKKGLLKKIFGHRDKSEDKDDHHLGRDAAVATAGAAAVGEGAHHLHHKPGNVSENKDLQHAHQDVQQAQQYLQHAKQDLQHAHHQKLPERGQVGGALQQGGIVHEGFFAGGPIGGVADRAGSEELPRVPNTGGRFLNQDASAFSSSTSAANPVKAHSQVPSAAQGGALGASSGVERGDLASGRPNLSETTYGDSNPHIPGRYPKEG